MTYDGGFSSVTRCQSETITLDGTSLKDLIVNLNQKYGRDFTDILLDPGMKDILPGVVALVNGRKAASLSEKLQDQDEVSFLFAIAGG